MGINSQTWDFFTQVLKGVTANLPGRSPIKVLCLGYIDFLITKDDVVRAYGQTLADSVVIREDSQSIAAWHGSRSTVIDAMSLFKALGYQIDFMDITASRGHEIVQDLNEPFPERLNGVYDIVLDSGTLEHCFNIGQAMKNLAKATSVGGYIYHSNPLNMLNHGFYNFSPTFYADFYAANQFEVVDLISLQVLPTSVKLDRLPPVQRFVLDSVAERTAQVISRKKAEGPIVWPMQSKYVQNKNLRG